MLTALVHSFREWTNSAIYTWNCTNWSIQGSRSFPVHLDMYLGILDLDSLNSLIFIKHVKPTIQDCTGKCLINLKKFQKGTHLATVAYKLVLYQDTPSCNNLTTLQVCSETKCENRSIDEDHRHNLWIPSKCTSRKRSSHFLAHREEK